MSTIESLNLLRDSFITVMSQRRSGKSVLLSNLIHYFLTAPEENRCQFAYLFSKTAKINQATNASYSFFDKRAVFDPDALDRILPSLLETQKRTHMKYHVLLVFDDIVVSKRYAGLEWLASSGRHYSITVILSSQISNNAVSPIVRSNVDYVFWRKLGADALKNNIFPFMSITEFRKYNELQDYTLANTDDYQFIFYDNGADGDSNKIQVVRAQDLPEGFTYKAVQPQTTKKKGPNRPGVKWF